jgi:hypothetical protein
MRYCTGSLELGFIWFWMDLVMPRRCRVTVSFRCVYARAPCLLLQNLKGQQRAYIRLDWVQHFDQLRLPDASLLTHSSKRSRAGLGSRVPDIQPFFSFLQTLMSSRALESRTTDRYMASARSEATRCCRIRVNPGGLLLGCLPSRIVMTSRSRVALSSSMPRWTSLQAVR